MEQLGAVNFKSHEAEDADNIPEVLLSPDLLLSRIASLPDRGQLPQLYRARDESRRQGKRMLEMREKKDLDMLCIEARWKSFEDCSDNMSWEGPCTRQMALAGFCRTTNSRAECCYCKVTIRNWSPTDNAWTRHKQYSPHCRRLKQVGEGGIHPSPEGKRRLRHSLSSIHDLKRPA